MSSSIALDLDDRMRGRQRPRRSARSSRAWKPAIKANLQVTPAPRRSVVDEFELPDEAEPAPVFEA